MSDLFKSTYNPDALSCITTRRRLEGRGRAQSAPESGGGFPGGVFPVGPSPKVPGRLAGGFRVRRGSVGTGRHPVPPAAGPRAGVGRKVPRNLAGGSPAAFSQLGRFPKCPGGWRGAPPAPVAARRRPASAPHPTRTPPPTQRRRDRLQKGEGYIPLPHHVTPRPSQLKAAQSSKDYCDLT